MKYFLTFSLLMVLPIAVFARHDRYELDGDPVDEIPVPVLFMDLADIVPNFGADRDGGARSHEGQDLIAPKGTPIVSPTAAVVIGVGTWSGGGRYVQTTNPGGERFRYMHLDEWADVDVGDELDAGDYIGTVGDTGNAPDGVYHLHFETLDEDGDPADPYDRLSEAFGLEDQMEFLDNVFSERRDDSDYAEFLVATFPSVFTIALQQDIDLPRAIERALEDTDIEGAVEELDDVRALIESIPSLLPIEMGIGDQGATVALLQIYLMYGTEGAARDRLVAAGPTGYYGSITAAAVRALQAQEHIAASGIYDNKTQSTFADRELEVLNI